MEREGSERMNPCRTTGHQLITLTCTSVEKHGHMTTRATYVQLASVHSTRVGCCMAVPRFSLRVTSN